MDEEGKYLYRAVVDVRFRDGTMFLDDRHLTLRADNQIDAAKKILERYPEGYKVDIKTLVCQPSSYMHLKIL